MKLTKERLKTMLGVYACAFCFMGMMAPVPVISQIAMQFPETDIVLIQMIVSTPPLLAAFAGMGVSAFLAHRFYKRYVALVSMCIMLLAGMSIFLFAHNSVYEVLVFSALFGIGFGGAQNSSDALLADYFIESERSVVFGLFGVAVGLGGIIWPAVAGACASTGGWVNAYLSFLLIIPMFIISFICLPKGKLEPKRKVNALSNLPKLVIMIACYCLVFNLAIQLYNTNVSLIVAESGLGGVAEASLATMTFNCAGLIGGVVVGPLFKAFKNRAIPITVCVSLIGLALVAFASSLPMLCIGGFLMSFGQQAFIPLTGNFTAANSEQAGRAFNLAFAQSGNTLGQALSPMVFGAAAAPLGGTIAAKLDIGIVMLVIVIVIGFIVFRKLTPKQVEEIERMEAFKRGEIEDASKDVIIEK